MLGHMPPRKPIIRTQHARTSHAPAPNADGADPEMPSVPASAPWSQRQHDVLLGALRRGHYIAVAAKLAGIPTSTLYQVREKSGDLRVQLSAALAASEDACLGSIADEPSWQARAWILERRFPARWAKRVDLATPGAGAEVSREQERVLAEWAAAKKSDEGDGT
jgi:hypothetical protein